VWDRDIRLPSANSLSISKIALQNEATLNDVIFSIRYFDKKSGAHDELRWILMLLPVIRSRISAIDDLLHPDAALPRSVTAP
jgi:hypothetical protein